MSAGKRVLVIGGCGYVGSALVGHLQGAGHHVESVDLELRGNPGRVPNARRDYRDLPAAFLGEFDVVLMLAAHPGIAEAREDPSGAIANNILGFYQLLEKLTHQQFVYASTARLYDGSGGDRPSESSAPGFLTTMYDITKATDDLLAQAFCVRATGLRLGTVSGPSPNYRSNTIVNSMVASALVSGSVTAGDPGSWRPILAMPDLCRAVGAVVERPGNPGIYNLASFNTTVRDAARAVGARARATVFEETGAGGAGFSMDTTKFEDEYQFTFEVTLDTLVESTFSFACGRRTASVPPPRRVPLGV